MILVSGTFEVADDDIDEVVPIVLEMAAASEAEPGCVSYAFYRDLRAANRFRVFEEWRDAEALAEHFQTPHMKAFRQHLGAIRILHRDVREYVVESSRPLG